MRLSMPTLPLPTWRAYVDRPSGEGPDSMFDDTLVLAMDRCIFYALKLYRHLLPINGTMELRIFSEFSEIADVLLETQ